MKPVILKREEHPISRKDFSEEATKVLYRLKNQGFTSYLCGGCVRDLLLDIKPKDFDIVTNATPQQVKRNFTNCRLIGRRFRLAHVYFQGGDVIEVATFRAPPPTDDDHHSKHVKKEGGLVTRDNEFGTPEEDALRRDFTINALFYNIADFSIIDYANGLEDIENRLVRMIGNPDDRYAEDPVRMLRAIRFAGSLDLTIEEETYASILRNRRLMAQASNARMFEEVLKLLNSRGAERCFALLQESELLDVMMPTYTKWLRENATDENKEWIGKVLRQCDTWRKNDVTPDPALQFTLLFHPYHEFLAKNALEDGVEFGQALSDAVDQHQKALTPTILISQRDLIRMKRILTHQTGFSNQSPKWGQHLADRREFHNAFIFLKFRNSFLGGQEEVIAWWEAHLPTTRSRQEAIQDVPPKRQRRRRKPRGPKPPPPATEA